MSFQIVGTGSSLPKKIVSNTDLSAFLNTTDDWITSRTGIQNRHVCVEETVAQLGAQAGLLALEQAGISPGELDLIMIATISGDYATPSTACVVQKLLGATCPALDINAACSGFVYALDVAASYLDSCRAQKILVIGAEAMSRLVDWDDRSTCVLFGVGAGAVVLERGHSLLAIKLTAKGDTELLASPGIGGNSPFAQPSPLAYLSMMGQEVYKFAVSAASKDLTDVFDMAGVSEQSIDFVLLHQANIRIIDAVCARLSSSPQKFIRNIDRCGNTSAASIPILLDELHRSGQLKPGTLLALSAFGGGLTTAACVIQWQ